MSNLPGNSIRVTKNTQFKNGVLEVIESIEEENTSVQHSFTEIDLVKENQELKRFSLTNSCRQNLQKLSKYDREYIANTLDKEKGFKEEFLKEIKKFEKIRISNKLGKQYMSDNQLTITAINNLFKYCGDIQGESLKKNEDSMQKKVVKPVQNKAKVNQQKQINKLIESVTDSLNSRNYSQAKLNISSLNKRFGKEETIQDKLIFYNYISNIIEELERQDGFSRDLRLGLEKVSRIDLENVNATLQGLKASKRDLTLLLNKESKKQIPNQAFLASFTQLDKINNTVISFLEPKLQKKPTEIKTKKEIQLTDKLAELQKINLENKKIAENISEITKFSENLLTKSNQNKQQLFKELESLRRNKKKSIESPYNIFIKLYELCLNNKKQVNEVSVFLKNIGMAYQKKVLNSEALAAEVKKNYEKYPQNQTLGLIKINLQNLIFLAQERERNTIEIELKKLRIENEKLQKQNSEIKGKVSESVSTEVKSSLNVNVASDNRVKLLEKEIQHMSKEIGESKRRELEATRLKDLERNKNENEEKDMEKHSENILNFLRENKTKVARNQLLSFKSKYQHSALSSKYLSTLNMIFEQVDENERLTMVEKESEKKQKLLTTSFEKEKSELQKIIFEHELYEKLVLNLLETLEKSKPEVNKELEEARKDKKRAIQERYIMLIKLQQLIKFYRQKNDGNHSFISNMFSDANHSLSYSENSQTIKPSEDVLLLTKDHERLELENHKIISELTQLKIQLKESGALSKEVNDLNSLLTRIEKGGEWWKFIPKNAKFEKLELFYKLIDKYRTSILSIAKYQQELSQKSEGVEMNEGIRMQMSEPNKAETELLTFVVKLKGIEHLIAEKKYLSEDNFWEKNLSHENINQPLVELLRVFQLITQQAKQKIVDDRQNNEKSIHSYEEEIQNLTNLITTLERNLKQKDNKIIELSALTNKIDKLQESSSKKSSELRNSRKSSKEIQRSASASKLKNVMQGYIEEEKSLLFQIQFLNQEKKEIEVKFQMMRQELMESQKMNEDLKEELSKKDIEYNYEKNGLNEKLLIYNDNIKLNEQNLRSIEQRFSDDLQYYKEAYAILQNKVQEIPQQPTDNSNLIQNITNQAYREFSEKEDRYISQYNQLSLEKEILLKKYHEDVLELEGLLTQETTNLKKQLEEIKKNTVTIIDYQALKNQNEQLVQQNSHLHSSLQGLQPINLDANSDQVSIENQSFIMKEMTQLRFTINHFNQQKNNQIEHEVLKALKSQEIQFNEYLKKYSLEKQVYYETVIIPLKIEEHLKNNRLHINPSEIHEDHIPQILIRKEFEWQSQLPEIIEREKMIWIKFYEQNQLKLHLHQYKLELEAEWKHKSEEEWVQRLIQVENYWETIIIPERKVQWEEERKLASAQTQQVTPEFLIQKEEEWKANYLPAIVDKEKKGWMKELLANRNSLLEVALKDSFVVSKINSAKRQEWEQQWNYKQIQIDQHWENVILPQREKEWQDKHVKAEGQIIKVESASEDVINQKIEEWKVIHLHSILNQKEAEWEYNFKTTELVRILHDKETQWEASKTQKIKASHQADIDQIVKKQRVAWEQQKALQWSNQIKEIQAYWLYTVIPNKIQQWEASHSSNVVYQIDQIQLERRIQQQKLNWEQEKSKEFHSTFNEMKIREVENDHHWNVKLIEMQHEWNISKQKELEEKVSRRVLEEKVKWSEESTSRNVRLGESQTLSLKKMNESQHNEIVELQNLVKHLERYKEEVISQKETTSKIESSHLKELNQQKLRYDSKINQLNHEKMLISIQFNELQTSAFRQHQIEKQVNNSHSQERQIATLESTLKTKDSEIHFLKQTIESINTENLDLKQKLMNHVNKQNSLEKGIHEIRNQVLKAEYENKYLKDNESSFHKKLDQKDQEIVEVRKKYQIQYGLLENKVKNAFQNQEYASQFQSKVNELENTITMKALLFKNLQSEYDKKKREAEEQYFTNRSLLKEVQQLKSQARNADTQLEYLKNENRKLHEEVNHLKIINRSSEEKQSTSRDLVMKCKNQIQACQQNVEHFAKETEKLKHEKHHLLDRIKAFENNELKQIEQLKAQINQLKAQTKQLQFEKENNLHAEYDKNEIEILRKINRDVTDLTSSNLQLQKKVVLLENKEKITKYESEVINYFLLIQQQMDALIAYLISQQILTEAESYHKFANNSRNILKNSTIFEYFSEWQKFMRSTFHKAVSIKTDQLKGQARELIILREEMNEVLDRQLEITDNETLQIIEEYKAVLQDVKKLVKEYLSTGDQQYLELVTKTLSFENDGF